MNLLFLSVFLCLSSQSSLAGVTDTALSHLSALDKDSIPGFLTLRGDTTRDLFAATGIDTTNNPLTKELMIPFLNDARRGAIEGKARIDAEQTQMMGWTLAGLVALIGFAFGKNGLEHRLSLFTIAFFFCLFMHALNTLALDVSCRELVFRFS